MSPPNAPATAAKPNQYAMRRPISVLVYQKAESGEAKNGANIRSVLEN